MGFEEFDLTWREKKIQEEWHICKVPDEETFLVPFVINLGSKVMWSSFSLILSTAELLFYFSGKGCGTFWRSVVLLWCEQRFTGALQKLFSVSDETQKITLRQSGELKLKRLQVLWRKVWSFWGDMMFRKPAPSIIIITVIIIIIIWDSSQRRSPSQCGADVAVRYAALLTLPHQRGSKNERKRSFTMNMQKRSSELWTETVSPLGSS